MNLLVLDDKDKRINCLEDVPLEIDVYVDVIVVQRPHDYFFLKNRYMICRNEHIPGQFLDKQTQRNDLGVESVLNQSIYEL